MMPPPTLPLERGVARAAATWMVRLREAPSAADLSACARWRAADPEHERAWQLVQQLHAKFDAVPTRVGMNTLGRAPHPLERRAAIKALTVLLLAAPLAYQGYHTLPWRQWRAQERSAVGQRRTVMLADGTRVELNTATSFDTLFDASRRQLLLRGGEVLIETGDDAQHAGAAYRPFLVSVRAGEIRPLGTRFLVRDDGEGEVLVSVQQGAVEVRPRQAQGVSQVIVAGQQLRFTAQATGPVTVADAHAADWVRGVLVAEAMRLDVFLEQLNRYRHGVLRCDPAVAALPISGAFQLAAIDQILDTLPAILPVQVFYRTRYWVTVATPSSKI